MSPAFKWIGGTTVAVLALMGSALVAGRALEPAAIDPGEWLAPDDVVTGGEAAPVERALSEPDAPAPAEGETPGVAEAEPQAEPAPAYEPFVIKRILPIEGPIRYGEWHWDDEGVPDGPLVMTVDLEARVLSVFRGGYEIGAAAVLLGTPEHPTPTGVFPILTKERHNVSEKYNNAPMPWTLRLTWDGVAIHGGSTVERGYASHGCISGPDDFVSKLFAIAGKGDRVIITDGKRAALGDQLI